MKRLRVLSLTAGLLLTSVSAFAALSAGQKMAVDALIKQFSAADFDQRQKAVDRLIEMGPDVAPAVKKALADTVDNEVKMRCDMVLKGLREKFGAAAVDGAKETPVTPPAAPGDFGPSKVTMDFNEAQLDEILARFAEQSGNSKVHVPEKWDGEPVTFAVKDMAYWDALEKLCGTIGHVYYNYDYSRTTGACNGMGLWKTTKGTEIGAASGPVSVKLGFGTRSRFLRGQNESPSMFLGLADIPVSGNVITYSMTYYWEDRLPVLSREGRVTKMVGSDGKTLKLLDRPQGMGEFARDPGVKPFFASVEAVALDAPDGLDRIAEIDGIVTLTLGKGERTITINDVLNAAGKSVTEGDTTITVVKVNNQPGWLSVVVKLKKGDKEMTVPVYPYGESYGFELVGADGKKVRAMSHNIVTAGGIGFAPGMMKGPGNDKLGPNEASVNFYTGQGRGLRDGNPQPPEKIEGVWTLIYTGPGECVSREYPFTLKDVPLP